MTRHISLIACLAGAAFAAQGQSLPTAAVGVFAQETRAFIQADDGIGSDDVQRVRFAPNGVLHVETAAGTYTWSDERWTPSPAFPDDGLADALQPLIGHTGITVLDAAAGPSNTLIVGAEEGLYYRSADGEWGALYPRNETYSWAPRPVPAVAVGPQGELWFASPQGVGRYDGEAWQLYTGADGLPWNEFTSLAVAPDGQTWFGTTRGAIRWDGSDFRYRQGLRWLPSDNVRDVTVDADGSAWFATPAGLGRIDFAPMTLAGKARHFEDLIDRYNRRTEYGFVIEASFAEPGNLESDRRLSDSDNDGLWSSMYGAGACFAYAATGSEDARRRATQVWNAMKKLGTVTQGGSHPAPAGFVARTIVPVSDHNPNESRYTPERDRERQSGDRLWKVVVPRWPVSEDGAWYWKTDTSSDELDGHYFFYALYYDLVCDTEEEKAEVRERVRSLTDHLIEHGFNLVDHDGIPTRWARYSPEELNHDKNWWVERGLNSLSMLSYLAVAGHVTGDSKYREVATILIDEHGYAQNLMYPKYQRGAGSGNQSDDEMAVMCYYNLLKYEQDPALRSRYAVSWHDYWRILEPEMNPFFNFAFASQCTGETYSDAWGDYAMDPYGDWLADSVDALVRWPLDRFDWRHTNAHRLDIQRLPHWTPDFGANPYDDGRGLRFNGKTLPVDECYFNHHNRDAWRLDTGGSGRTLGSGTVFLLPYYMGLYHGFIDERG